MQNIVQLSLPKKIPKILGYAKYRSIIVTAKKFQKYWDTQNIIQLSLLQKNSKNIGICKISFNYRYRKKSPNYWDTQNIVQLSLLQKNSKNIGIRKISSNYRYRKKSPKYWDTQNIVQLSLPKKSPKYWDKQNIVKLSLLQKIPQILGYAKYRSIIVTKKNPQNIGIRKISFNYSYQKKSPNYWDTQNIVQLSLPIKRPKISGYAKYRSIIVTNKNPPNIGIRKISSNYRYRKKSPKYWDTQNIVQLSLPIKRPKISGYAKYRQIIVTNKKAQNIGIRKISFNYRYQ